MSEEWIMPEVMLPLVEHIGFRLHGKVTFPIPDMILSPKQAVGHHVRVVPANPERAFGFTDCVGLITGYQNIGRRTYYHIVPTLCRPEYAEQAWIRTLLEFFEQGGSVRGVAGNPRRAIDSLRALEKRASPEQQELIGRQRDQLRSLRVRDVKKMVVVDISPETMASLIRYNTAAIASPLLPDHPTPGRRCIVRVTTSDSGDSDARREVVLETGFVEHEGVSLHIVAPTFPLDDGKYGWLQMMQGGTTDRSYPIHRPPIYVTPHFMYTLERYGRAAVTSATLPKRAIIGEWLTVKISAEDLDQNYSGPPSNTVVVESFQPILRKPFHIVRLASAS